MSRDIGAIGENSLCISSTHTLDWPATTSISFGERRRQRWHWRALVLICLRCRRRTSQTPAKLSGIAAVSGGIFSVATMPEQAEQARRPVSVVFGAQTGVARQGGAGGTGRCACHFSSSAQLPGGWNELADGREKAACLSRLHPGGIGASTLFTPPTTPVSPPCAHLAATRASCKRSRLPLRGRGQRPARGSSLLLTACTHRGMLDGTSQVGRLGQSSTSRRANSYGA